MALARVAAVDVTVISVGHAALAVHAMTVHSAHLDHSVRDTAVRVSSGYGRVLASKSNIFSTLQQEADCKPDHACQPHRAQTKPRHLEIRPGVGVAFGVPVE